MPLAGVGAELSGLGVHPRWRLTRRLHCLFVRLKRIQLGFSGTWPEYETITYHASIVTGINWVSPWADITLTRGEMTATAGSIGSVNQVNKVQNSVS